MERKTKGTQRVIFNVSCQPEQLEQIRKEAEKQNTSVSKLVVKSVLGQQDYTEKVYKQVIEYRNEHMREPEKIIMDKAVYDIILEEYKERITDIPDDYKFDTLAGIPLEIVENTVIIKL